MNNWPIYTPFNFEKVWYQDLNSNNEWLEVIPKYELFTNFDDKNRDFGESLIKRKFIHLMKNILALNY